MNNVAFTRRRRVFLSSSQIQQARAVDDWPRCRNASALIGHEIKWAAANQRSVAHSSQMAASNGGITMQGHHKKPIRHILGSQADACRAGSPFQAALCPQRIALLVFSEKPLEVLPRRCALNLEASVRQAGFLTSPNPRPSATAHHLFHRFPPPTPSEYPARVDILDALADAILLTPILAIFQPGGGRKQSTLRSAAPIGARCLAARLPLLLLPPNRLATSQPGWSRARKSLCTQPPHIAAS